MGHYASEMMGPYTGPSNREQAEEEAADLKHDWELGLQLFNSGHQGRSKRTCPQCFVRIEFLFLEKHDEWHANLARVANQADSASLWTNRLA